LEDIDANAMRWYHGSLDINTSADAARATVELANRHRKNIDFIGVVGANHYQIQQKKWKENMDWLRK
jgi:predicted urease superfamily metal-dependent hydrolase